MGSASFNGSFIDGASYILTPTATAASGTSTGTAIGGTGTTTGWTTSGTPQIPPRSSQLASFHSRFRVGSVLFYELTLPATEHFADGK